MFFALFSDFAFLFETLMKNGARGTSRNDEERRGTSRNVEEHRGKRRKTQKNDEKRRGSQMVMLKAIIGKLCLAMMRKNKKQ